MWTVIRVFLGLFIGANIGLALGAPVDHEYIGAILCGTCGAAFGFV